MTTFNYQNKEYEVTFDWSYLKLRKNVEHLQEIYTCFIAGPNSTFADLAILNPIDSNNPKKAQRLAFERAARKMSAHLYKKGGPRPAKIKSAIISAYNDAILKEVNPELWEQVQQKKAQQKLINDTKRAENKALKKEQKEKLQLAHKTHQETLFLLELLDEEDYPTPPL